MRAILTSFLCFSVYAASDLNFKFNYIPSLGAEAELQGECFDKALIKCQFTEVRAVPMESWDEHTSLHETVSRTKIALLRDAKPKASNLNQLDESKMSREEKRKYWKQWFVKEMGQKPDQFEIAKQEACRKEARDQYDYRAAFHEGFDEFNDRAKNIQDKKCKAKDPNAYAQAEIEHWDLTRSTCELKYFETDEVEIEKQSFEVKTMVKKNKQNGFQVVRTYRGPDKKTRELVFDPRIPRRLPKACKYLLDRQRASHCCAYQP